MDDPPMAVPALAGQVPALLLARTERNPERCELLDRQRRILDDIFDGRAVVEARACDHRVLDMRLERVAFLKHRGDAALRPGGRPFGNARLGEDRDPVTVGEIERGGQPGGARADDDDIETMLGHALSYRSSRPPSPASARNGGWPVPA
jgi:hypothetical protein